MVFIPIIIDVNPNSSRSGMLCFLNYWRRDKPIFSVPSNFNTRLKLGSTLPEKLSVQRITPHACTAGIARNLGRVCFVLQADMDLEPEPS